MTVPPPEQPARPASARRWLAPLLIVALMLAGYGLGLQRYLSLESLAAHRESLRAFTDAHALGAVLIFIAVYAVAVALSFPGASALTVAGGLLFGWLAGGLAAVVAATLGGMAIFLIARSSFGEALSRKGGERMQKLRQGFARDAFSYLLFLRLVPLFPFWLVNLASAFTGMRLATFASATAMGIIPGTFAFAFLGEGLDSVVANRSEAHAACLAAKGPENCHFELSVQDLVTAEMLVAFAALGLVALVPVGLRKWKGNE
ncbi:MAG: TVP38/TMEM64 family protein [Rhizobiales bacterium]|nr:TVP38/TMEM64 family protein [Hyphomicrobiales bacterium]